jgi:hypothetical protein
VFLSGVAKILEAEWKSPANPKCELYAVQKVKVNDPFLLAEEAFSSLTHLDILQL